MLQPLSRMTTSVQNPYEPMLAGGIDWRAFRAGAFRIKPNLNSSPGDCLTAHNHVCSCRSTRENTKTCKRYKPNLQRRPPRNSAAKAVLARIAESTGLRGHRHRHRRSRGIGRTLASREANSPECRQLIAEFVGDEWEEMRAVFYRSMRAIEHALSARREHLTEGRARSAGWPGPLCASRCDEALP